MKISARYVFYCRGDDTHEADGRHSSPTKEPVQFPSSFFGISIPELLFRREVQRCCARRFDVVAGEAGEGREEGQF